jgi:hypothetical protein
LRQPTVMARAAAARSGAATWVERFIFEVAPEYQ